jgi:NDP-sugar pyrophosphorylase family protein
MKALILAAGEGTRLRPLTLECPKPMLPVGGRPILEHLIGLLRKHGVSHIAINLHYKPETIVRHFGDGSRFGVAIEYSRESRLLGTAGAAKQLDWFLTEPFFVLYGDVLTSMDLRALADAHRKRGAFATLALHEPEDPTRCGVVELMPDGRIVSFIEKPPYAAPGALANAGVCLFEPQILASIQRGEVCDFGLDVLPALVGGQAPVYGYVAHEYILDIGSPERYAQAKTDFDTGKFASPLDDPTETPALMGMSVC